MAGCHRMDAARVLHRRRGRPRGGQRVHHLLCGLSLLYGCPTHMPVASKLALEPQDWTNMASPEPAVPWLCETASDRPARTRFELI